MGENQNKQQQQQVKKQKEGWNSIKELMQI